MGIDHRGANVAVAEQLLNRVDVVTVFKQVRRKRVVKCVRTRRFVDIRLAHRFFYRLLQYRLAEMMAPLFTGDPVDEMTRCQKDPLPAPLFSSIGIFALKRIGQGYAA